MDTPVFSTLKDSPIAGRIYLSCVYEWKDTLKALGPFKWDSSIKLWYIYADDFTLDIYTKTRTARIFDEQNPYNTKTYYYTKYYSYIDFCGRCAKFHIDPDVYLQQLNRDKPRKSL